MINTINELEIIQKKVVKINQSYMVVSILMSETDEEINKVGKDENIQYQVKNKY